MKKTFVFDREQGRMVELERQPAPIYTGTKLDPTSVDAAIPRALKALGDMDEYRHMSKRQLANAMGYNSLETVKRTWNHLLCFALLLATCVAGLCQVPPYITPGIQLTNGQVLTAGQLNALVANASIGYGFYSTATGETVLGTGDRMLVLNAGNQYRLISANNAIFNNTNWYALAAQETNVTTNAYVLVLDGGTNGQVFKVGLTNWPQFTFTNAVIGESSNLKFVSGMYTNGTTSGIIGYLTADEVLLKSIYGTGATFLARNLSVNMNGANWTGGAPWGGVENAYQPNLPSTWYYIWVLSDGVNQGAVLSTNRFFVTNWGVIPGGITNVVYSAMVGAFVTDASGNLDDFLQLGTQCYFDRTNLLNGNISTGWSAMWATNQGGTQPGVATNLAVNFNMMVPPIAKTVTGTAGQGGPDSTPDNFGMSLSAGSASFNYGNTNFLGEVVIAGLAYNNASNPYNGFSLAQQFTVPVQTTSSNVLIWWRSLDTTQTNKIDLTGYGL